MKLPPWRKIRPVVLMVGAVLASTGAIPKDVAQVMVDNGEHVAAGLMAIWSATAFLRNHKDSKAAA